MLRRVTTSFLIVWARTRLDVVGERDRGRADVGGLVERVLQRGRRPWAA